MSKVARVGRAALTAAAVRLERGARAARARKLSAAGVKARAAKATARASAYKMLGVIRAAVDEAAGRAIAAVLHDKTLETVTPEEAGAALKDPEAVGDRPRTYRAIRAGILAAVTKLTPDAFPPALAQQVEDGMIALDKGEATGWATPEPGKRSAPGKRAFKAHWFAIEVTFQKEQLKRSSDWAIGAVAGQWRGKRPKDAPPPILLWRASIEALQKHLKQGEAVDPDAIAEAAAEGKKVAAGGKASADFMRRRAEYIAVWNARTKRSSPRDK